MTLVSNSILGQLDPNLCEVIAIMLYFDMGVFNKGRLAWNDCKSSAQLNRGSCTGAYEGKCRRKCSKLGA